MKEDVLSRRKEKTWERSHFLGMFPRKIEPVAEMSHHDAVIRVASKKKAADFEPAA
jgi:hypothetical protein